MASQTMNTWKTMDKKSIRQLAAAVFFLFATIGPLTLMMESSIIQSSWMRLIVMTILSGLFSASIILFMNKPLRLFLSIFAYVAVVLTLAFTDPDILKPDVENITVVPNTPFSLSPEQLSDIQTKRTMFGLLAVLCLSTGYSMFVRTISKEYKRRTEIETEVKIAQSIHESLLPRSAVTTAWCDIAGISLPATEIGGDFYDIIKLSETKILIVIADASGHGTGAGILSAMTKSSIIQELQHTQSPAELLGNVNRTIYSVTEKNKFITCALVLMDKETSTATIVTAGHPQILHRSGNRVNEFRTHHLALGMQLNSTFGTETIPLQKGDTLYLITDGVLEASNVKNGQFGMERLHLWILGSQPSDAQQQCIALIGSIRAFTATKELKDDATVVVISYT
jgi:sigma-B regulation protein RsbU (phosphoserine phosphatase)